MGRKDRNILGISAFYHDSAAALITNGNLTAAAQEERFSRVKHDSTFPFKAVQYCLKEGQLGPGDIEYVVFYDKPLLKFDRLLETYLAYAPRGLRSFLEAMPLWLKTKLHLPRIIRRELGPEFRGRLLFTGHHEAHAASAFFPSPFQDAAVLTVDGVGEWDTATIGVGENNEVRLLRALHFPHSLGLLYSAFTYFCGFKVNSGEYKLMGLAPYREPRFAQRILDQLIDLREDGSFAMDMAYFNYCEGLTMTGKAFEALFEGPPRKPDSMISKRERDLAASIQKVTEEVLLRMAQTTKELTGKKHLCLAGGVALNCVANGKLLRNNLFDDIWIQPASGDAGGALGAALLLHYQLLNNDRNAEAGDLMQGALVGPSFGDDQVERALTEAGVSYRRFEDEADLLTETADALAQEQIVGWFQGRMEFGPRALGARSILGDPRSPRMQAQMNLRIKYRESFRPFAPAVLRERVSEYFELDTDSPYMLLVADVAKAIRRKLNEEAIRKQEDDDLRVRVNVVRSEVPAITHVDMSARIQTVDEKRHGRFWKLLNAFSQKTACGLLVNTSFNIRGEPIVCTPEEALRCFLGTEMNLLVMGNHIIEKVAQKPLSDAEKAKYQENISEDSGQQGYIYNRFAEVDWNPDRRERRKFGFTLALGFPVMATMLFLILRLVTGDWRPHAPVALAAIGSSTGLLLGFIPAIARPFYCLWYFLICMIDTVVTTFLLTLCYAVVLTPVGLAMRIFGRQPIQKGFTRETSSYWREVSEARTLARYYRQF